MSNVSLTNCTTSAFRIAHESPYPHPLASTPREIYHTLTPHPALAPVPLDGDPSTLLEQERNEEAWRQLLVQAVLAVLLPTEDLENGCLRALVAEILAEMILGNGLSKKACEPWLLWDAITTVIEAARPRTLNKDAGRGDAPSSTTSRLEQFGLVSGSKETVDDSRRYNLTRQGSAALSSASSPFWTVVQYIFMASMAVRALISALATSSRLPSRSKTWLSRAEAASRSERSSASLPNGDQRPVLSMAVWTMVGHLMEVRERMPWLYGLLALLQHAALSWPGRAGDTDGALDRYVCFHPSIFPTTIVTIPPFYCLVGWRE